jgi:hypothetical protein
MANMQVTVVDGNNVTVSLDRGVAGVGIASISLVVINQANYLLITYTNGTTQTVGPVGVIQYNATSPIDITGSTISLTTVPVNLGGTGQTTATAGLNALLPAQTSQANKYLQTDGTNASWDAISLSTADITGILPVVNGGTGVGTSTGTGNTVLSTSPTLVTPALGTPASGVMTNVTGTAAGLTAGNVTTNANLTGMVTSVGNATTVVTNANLTGDITSIGNATAIAAGVIVNADINASAAIDDTKLATIATALKVSNSATTAASANTASAIVARDASGNFSAGTVTAALTGNSSTATALATGRTIEITGDLAYTSPSFDGSANVTATGTLATVATAGVTGSSTAIPVVTINAKGLTTGITTAAVIAPAGTLSGSTLAAGVTGSSLTSLGTIANLSVTAGTISTSPSASTDIANKDYVDNVAQGLDPKASCVAATTTNITLSGTQTIDGVALIAADRCLVKDQTAPAENGIYVVAAGAWARSTDMNVWLEVPGAFTFIEQGTLYADTGWVCTSNAGGTLGTTAITFVQFAGAGSYTASTGLTLTGTAFSLTAPVTVALGGTNATSAGIASFNNITGYTAAGATGTTSTNLVFSTSPTLVTPDLGTPQSVTLTNATGLPISTGVYGLGTGVATALAVNVGTAGSPVVNGGALGTPSSGTVTNLTGTASININGTVGATTPTTGAFTTLSATGAVTSGSDFKVPTLGYLYAYTGAGAGTVKAGFQFDGAGAIYGKIADTTVTNISSTGLAVTGTLSATGAVTLSGGTANGVAYLDGSKVLTTGTALTFDGTTLTTSGTSSGATSQLLKLSNIGTGANTKAQIGFFAASTEYGQISGGFGASSPEMNFILPGSSTGLFTWLTSAGAEQMRLTSTGLGIGTTSPGYKLDVLSTGNVPAQFSSSNASNTLIQQTNTNAAKDLIYRFRQNAGAGNWYDLTMEGSTNAFTIDYNDNERLRLDSTGNLGLGVTPSAWDTVYKGLQLVNGGSVAAYTASVAPIVALSSNWYYNGGDKYVVTGPASQYVQNQGVHQWFNAASGTAGNAITFTQAMTLDASGNLGVGTTTALARLTTSVSAGSSGSVNNQIGMTHTGASTGYYIATIRATGSDEPAGLAFKENATERARIDSSGNLLVGTTTAGAGAGFPSRIAVDAGAGDVCIFKTSDSTNAFPIRAWNSGTTGDNVWVNFATETSYTSRGSITYNRTGGLIVYGTTSDYRAKDINGPVTNSGALIDSIPVYMGKMKWATQERPMFIAHEVPAYAHTGEKDAVDKDGKPVYQQMDAAALIPVMWAELQSLRARVAQLESKP